jgi:hypothetical protein
MIENTDWFIDSATPRPDLRAWYIEDGEPITHDCAPVMAVERLYPVDRNGRRLPGAEWLDTRIEFLDMDGDGSTARAADAANFYALLPASESAEEVRAAYAEFRRRTDRESAVAAVRAGEHPRDVARRLGVGQTAVRRWCQLAEDGAA